MSEDIDAVTADAPPVRDEGEAAHRMFGSDETLWTEFGGPTGQARARLFDAYGLDEAGQREHVLEFAHGIREAGIGTSEVAKLYPLAVAAETRPPDEPTLRQWDVETRQQARERYGADEAARRLALADQYIANRPALAKVAKVPAVRLALAERIRNEGEVPMKPRARFAKG